MTFYILFLAVILFVFFLAAYCKKKKLKLFVEFDKLAVGILIFVGIFRFDVGWDYVNYYDYIDKIQIDRIIRLEPLSQLLCYISIYLESPPVLFVFFGLPTYLLLFRTLKSFSEIFILSFFVYVAFYYLESFTSVRQALAISITFSGFTYIANRKILKYLCCVVFASLFHYSALVALIIYPIYHRVSFKTVCLFIPFLFLFKALFLELVLNYTNYGYYIDKLEEFTGGGIVKYVVILCFLLLCVLGFLKGVLKKNPFYKIVFISLFLPFLLGPALGARLGSYFSIYLCLLVPNVLKYYNDKVKFGVIVFCCFYFMLMISIASVNSFKSLYTPYQFIFNVENIQFR